QTTQLISRRIREIGVYSEVVPGDINVAGGLPADVKGVILSGSPWGVYETGAPAVDPALLDLGLPLLGICYGFHQLVSIYGGEVLPQKKKEFGRAPVHFKADRLLFEGVPGGFTSWMSHGDSVGRLPGDFELIATSESHVAAAKHREREIYGIQFHPEVTHCEYGNEILKNFAIGVCGARAEWSIAGFIEQESAALRQRTSGRKVLTLVSGGVDSTVVAALLLKALDPADVHLMYIDTGFMRKNETGEVERDLRALGAENLYVIDARSEFYSALSGIFDPEEKRRRIGDLFISVQEREIAARRVNDAFLAQGTLYTDMIESGKGIGEKAHVIKSHHNVRSPLVEEKRGRGEILEPLARLYKDEVRELGTLLGLAQSTVERHPFPGPGLAVRILGEVTSEKCDILREADSIFIEELKRRNLYDEIWQAFCVLLPVRSVGVTGDSRNYGYVVSLRAIVSRDGMTADVYPFEMKDLLEISSRITNNVPSIGRVVYDVSSKPPATIEWE
ncbi:MAG: glutamine-hydrolyzing GMP synthase, partial [Spirochaetales bacterium]|nr:glutamine-hydrolyzing GMP synthase [Spirochaetales bacterium]